MTYILTRSGDAPLQFEGELLASASSRTESGPRQNRWHHLDLYRTARGYVLGIVARSNWQGEDGHAAAWVCRTAAAVRRHLREYDPTTIAEQSRPSEPSRLVKHEQILAALRRGYDQAVSQVLAELPPELESDTTDFGEPRDERDLRRYRDLLARGMAECAEAGFTVAEYCLICDALNGCLLEVPGDDHSAWLWWPANVEDHIRLNGADQKWEVDGQALVDRISGLSVAAKAAIAAAAERFWEAVSAETDAEDRAQSLRDAGFVWRERSDRSL